MARQLINLAASVPDAQVRCRALAQLWRCVIDSEVAVRLAHARAERISGQAELKHLLSDAGVFDLISGMQPGEFLSAMVMLPYLASTAIALVWSAVPVRAATTDPVDVYVGCGPHLACSQCLSYCGGMALPNARCITRTLYELCSAHSGAWQPKTEQLPQHDHLL